MTAVIAKMKYCPKCKQLLNENKFYADSKTKDGLYYVCKECCGTRRKNQYLLNIEKERRIRREYTYENIEKVSTYKKEYYENVIKRIMHDLKINGCAICGYHKYDSGLEFHHVIMKNRRFTVNLSSLNRTSKSVIGELNKCVLLCTRCHREMHAIERGEKSNDT